MPYSFSYLFMSLSIFDLAECSFVHSYYILENVPEKYLDIKVKLDDKEYL